jgi:hypothetical protein
VVNFNTVCVCASVCWCQVMWLVQASDRALNLSHVRAERCRCAISRVERIPAQQLYISAATLQAFKCAHACSEHTCLCRSCSALFTLALVLFSQPRWSSWSMPSTQASISGINAHSSWHTSGANRVVRHSHSLEVQDVETCYSKGLTCHSEGTSTDTGRLYQFDRRTATSTHGQVVQTLCDQCSVSLLCVDVKRRTDCSVMDAGYARIMVCCLTTDQ